VKKIMDNSDGKAVVWLGGPATSQYGTTVYGFWSDYDIEIETGQAFGQIKVRGLV